MSNQTLPFLAFLYGKKQTEPLLSHTFDMKCFNRAEDSVKISHKNELQMDLAAGTYPDRRIG